MSEDAITGGCACKTVRYRLTAEPYDTGWCHCRLCQRTSGAPALAFTTSKGSDFKIESGGDSLKTYRSTPFGQRRFCGACGTLLIIQVDFQPDEVDIAVATLDDADRVRPSFHIFTEQAISWAVIEDGLPRFARFRPNTRGLPEGQTYPA